MFYSDDVIEEVRSKNDIIDIISSYVRLKKKGSSYMGLCPFHNEKSPSFSVSQSKQMYHCFGCGVGGNIFTFVMEYENLSFIEAIQYLANKAGINLPQGEMSSEEIKGREKRTLLLEIYKKTAMYYYWQLHNTEKGKKAYQYLIDRSLSDDTIKKFGLGYSNIVGGLYSYLKGEGYDSTILKESGLFNFDEKNGVYEKFWNRVMFPIMDVNNKVIGFGGRVLGDAKPKYLNSPETILFDKGMNLFGLNIARTSRKQYIIICEGYMDVITLYQAGYDNTVASLGTSLTGRQANLLKRYNKNILLNYDSDEAGIKAALRAIPILKNAGISVKVIDLKPYKDPDDFIKALGCEEFEKRVNNAQNSFYFEIDVLQKQFDLSDPEQKTKFHREIAKKMLVFKEELERDNYAEAIARKYMIPLDNFKKLINYYGAQVLAVGENEFKNDISNNRKRNDSAIKASQRMLLTWYTEEPKLFKILKNIIKPTDFKEPLYYKAASIMFKQYEENGCVIPAKIINAFDSKEEQNEAALVFATNISSSIEMNGEIQEFSELSNDEKETYLNQLVRTIKLNSIEYDLRNSVDSNVLKECSAEKARLQNLYIKIN